MKYYVYLFSIDGQPRYVGKGSSRRLKRHLQTIAMLKEGGKPRAQNWHYKAAKEGREVTYEVLYKTDSEIDAYAFEERKTRELGVAILDGGVLWNTDYGGRGQSSEGAKRSSTSEKFKSAARKNIAAYNASVEGKTHIVALAKEVSQRPEVQDKIRSAVSMEWQKPGVRVKRSENIKRAVNSIEVSQKRAIGFAEAMARPGRAEKWSQIALAREAKKREQRQGVQA